MRPFRKCVQRDNRALGSEVTARAVEIVKRLGKRQRNTRHSRRPDPAVGMVSQWHLVSLWKEASFSLVTGSAGAAKLPAVPPTLARPRGSYPLIHVEVTSAFIRTRRHRCRLDTRSIITALSNACSVSGGGQLKRYRSGGLGRMQVGVKAAQPASVCPPSAPGPVSSTHEHFGKTNNRRQSRTLNAVVDNAFTCL